MSDRFAGRERARRLVAVRRWTTYPLGPDGDPDYPVNLRLVAKGYGVVCWRSIVDVQGFFTRAERRG